MFVGVIHQIHDPERFRAAEAAATKKGFPSGVASPIEFMTPDDKTGISIWQGPSIDPVRHLVESVVGGCSDTEYLELEVRGLWDASLVGAPRASHEPGQGVPKAPGFSGPSAFALMPGWSRRTAG